MKRLVAMLLIVAVATIPFTCMAEQKWYQVQELREMTREGWHQTYETQWRTVRVDVDIEVPDVEAFPILKVVRMQPIAAEKLEGLDVFTNKNGNVYATFGALPEPTHNRAAFKSIVDFGADVPNALPENNDMTYEEALAVMGKVVSNICDRSIDDLFINSIRVLSRYYKYKIVDGNRVWTDPVSDRGYYQIAGQQMFHGIPIEYCGNYSTDGKYPTTGYAVMGIADSDNWGFNFAFLDEVDISYEDVPILSFEKAKAAYEELIYQGFVREVLEVRLCYTSYIDPNDKDVFYLLPVWYARCVYAKKADMEFPAFVDPSTGEVDKDTRQYEELVFEAQKGKLMDWDDGRRNRRDVPKILTWDDVR